MPTLTFIAAVNPVHYQFAEPVFMDCDDTYAWIRSIAEVL